jgi:hypothetical protein
MLRGENIPDEMLREPDVIDRLTAHLAVVMYQEDRAMGGGGGSDAVELAKGRFDRLWNTLIRGPSQHKVLMAVDSSGAGREVDSVGITRR